MRCTGSLGVAFGIAGCFAVLGVAGVAGGEEEAGAIVEGVVGEVVVGFAGGGTGICPSPAAWLAAGCLFPVPLDFSRAGTGGTSGYQRRPERSWLAWRRAELGRALRCARHIVPIHQHQDAMTKCQHPSHLFAPQAAQEHVDVIVLQVGDRLEDLHDCGKVGRRLHPRGSDSSCARRGHGGAKRAS